MRPGSAVLDDLTFDVQPGQVVALLGPTGSGKSTIINLIPRFYEVTQGAILVDGHDIRNVTLESLRRQIGIVLQETMLFGTTIRENIAFGRPDATQEEIEAAAKAARAHDFIVAFPQGYDTEVGERGVTLSGGQRQRIAIARALLLDPRILILDDATSSVDTETEQQIQAALANLMRGRTTFVIAQRVSTVRNADLILVIDRGKLVARGTHSDLIRESGIYADIYYRQLSTGSGQPQPVVAGGESDATRCCHPWREPFIRRRIDELYVFGWRHAWAWPHAPSLPGCHGQGFRLDHRRQDAALSGALHRRSDDRGAGLDARGRGAGPAGALPDQDGHRRLYCRGQPAGPGLDGPGHPGQLCCWIS